MYLAHRIDGFTDELKKIASGRKTAAALAGALVGGGLASMIPGAGRVKRGLIGAAAGGLIGGAVGMGTKAVHKVLAPSAAAYGPPTGDPNYVPTWQQGYER